MQLFVLISVVTTQHLHLRSDSVQRDELRADLVGLFVCFWFGVFEVYGVQLKGKKKV